MNAGRRIAAAVLATALSLGAIGITAGPAEAKKGPHGPSTLTDTTWPTMMDTTWPTGG